MFRRRSYDELSLDKASESEGTMPATYVDQVQKLDIRSMMGAALKADPSDHYTVGWDVSGWRALARSQAARPSDLKRGSARWSRLRADALAQRRTQQGAAVAVDHRLPIQRSIGCNLVFRYDRPAIRLTPDRGAEISQKTGKGPQLPRPHVCHYARIGSHPVWAMDSEAVLDDRGAL